MIGWLLACAGPAIVTGELPDAQRGEQYSVALETRGRRLGFSAEGLPEGLAVHPELGVLSGVPRVAGAFDVTVRVARGDEAATRTLTLQVRGAERGCGVELGGELTETALVDDDVDWAREGGWTVVELPIPGPEIDRVDFDVTGAALFLVEPGRVFEPGVRIHAQAEALLPRPSDGVVALGLNTIPHLGAHQAVAADPTLVVVAPAPGPWSVRTTCVPGPLVETRRRGPYRLGDRVLTGFGVTRPSLAPRFEALDPLPPGLELDPSGLVTGTAERAGFTEVRLRATLEDGRRSDFVADFGIHDPVRLDCGESRAFTSERAGTDLTDVRQFVSLEADWAGQVALAFTIDAGPSAITRVVPADRPLVAPLSDDLPFEEGPVTVSLAPDSWPDAATLQRWPQARLLVVDPAAPASGLARLDCSDGPLLDAPALPVLDAGRPLTLALPVAGGVPPFIFEAEGLPDSVRLTPEGILESDGTDFGSTLVTVTLVDAEGATWSTTEPLHASTAAACGPDAGVLRCGEEVADAPERVCLEATGLTEADWAVVGFLGQTRDEVAVLPPDPGDVEPSTFVRRRDLVLRRGGGVPLADLDAYEGLPVALRVRSDDPSLLCLRCGIGPLPDRPLDDCRP